MGVLARRYATALFQAAEQSDELDPVREAVAVLDQALADGDVRGFILDREQDRERKRATLAEGLQAAPVTFRNFLNLVFDRGREGLLLELGAEFARLDMHRRGEALGRLEVARDASSDEIDSIRTKGEAIFGVKVKLEVESNPELIGGFRLTVNNQRIDASVKTRLEKLKDSMSGASLG